MTVFVFFKASNQDSEEAAMGRIGSAMLDTNDMFPKLDLQLVTGETLKLPEETGEGYGVILFYRGHW